MQGLAQRCDGHSQSDLSAYGTTLERAQYHGLMCDIVERLRMLPPTHREERKKDEGRLHRYALRRSWSYGNETPQLPAEVPHLRITLEELRSNERRCGYTMNSERILEHLVLNLQVNKDSCADTFHDEGERESNYSMPGERYRWHDVGRWRGYSPEAVRIAQVVLAALTAGEGTASPVVSIESRVA